jgi:hypothetical protein
MLALHRELLALRREFAGEGYRTLAAGDETLAYRRGDRWAVVLNLSDRPAAVPVRGRVRLSTHLDRRGEELTELRPAEGVVVEIA